MDDWIPSNPSVFVSWATDEPRDLLRLVRLFRLLRRQPRTTPKQKRWLFGGKG